MSDDAEVMKEEAMGADLVATEEDSATVQTGIEIQAGGSQMLVGEENKMI